MVHKNANVLISFGVEWNSHSEFDVGIGGGDGVNVSDLVLSKWEVKMLMRHACSMSQLFSKRTLIRRRRRAIDHVTQIVCYFGLVSKFKSKTNHSIRKRRHLPHWHSDIHWALRCGGEGIHQSKSLSSFVLICVSRTHTSTSASSRIVSLAGIHWDANDFTLNLTMKRAENEQWKRLERTDYSIDLHGIPTTSRRPNF